MKNEKFTYNIFDGFMRDGEIIGIWEVLLILNELYRENELLLEENEFLNSYLEELEDDMFSEKDFFDYLQACHGGDVNNLKE